HARRRDLIGGARTGGRLHWPALSRHADDRAHAVLDPRAERGADCSWWARAVAAADPARSTDRCHVRPADPALVGLADRRVVGAAPTHLPRSGRSVSRKPRHVPRGARSRSVPAHARPPAVARPTAPRRAE